MPSTVRGKIGRGSLWISVTRAIVNLLGLLSTVVLARLLLPSDFGIVALGTTLLAIITAMTDFSMAQALIHHEDPTNEHMHTAWTLGMLRGLMVGGMFAAAGPFVADFYGDPRMINVMAIFGASIFLSGLANPRRVLQQKQLVFWQEFTLQVSQNLVRVAVSIGLAYSLKSYWALLLGTLAGQIASVAVSYMSMPYSPRYSTKHLRELWSFSFWLTMSSIINTINWRFDHLLVGKFLGTADLGYYTVGNNFAVIPTRESVSPLTKTLYPAFAQVRSDPERLRRAYQRAQTLVTAVALPLGVGTACVARPLVFLAMGERWATVAHVIEILASVFALQTLGSLAQPLAMANGRTKNLFARDVQMFAIRLPMIVVGMYYAGLTGILLARVASGLTTIIYQLRIVRDICGLTYFEQISSNYRSLTAVTAMAFGTFVTGQFTGYPQTNSGQINEFVVRFCTAAMIYMGTTIGLWALSGFCDGPEREIMTLVKSLKTRAAR